MQSARTITLEYVFSELRPFEVCTPESLYNTVRYNTILDITWNRVGPQMVI